MDNDIIQCPRCDTDNPVASDICYVCGEPLHEQPSDKGGKHWLTGLLILIAVGIGAFFLYNQFPRESAPPVVSQAIPATPLTPPAEKTAPAEKTDGSVKSDSMPAAPKTKEQRTLSPG